jgi:hypothetical protein
VFNHIQLLDPLNALNDAPDWGALESSGNQPRKLEFGFRLRF